MADSSQTTTAITSPPNFLVVRLAAGSVDEIRRIDEGDSTTPPFEINIQCKQVPIQANVDDICIVWLGSDNNKGTPTSWAQGFRAVGKIISITRHGGWKDPTDVGILIENVFNSSLSKTDIVRLAGEKYQYLVDFPIAGVNNYNSQVVQVVDPSDASQSLSIFSEAIQKSGNTIFENFLISGGIPLAGHSEARAGSGDSESPETNFFFEQNQEIPLNIIYFGPPGTGKTYLSRRLLKEYFEDGDKKYWTALTFHPGFSYEDFIEGIRPFVNKDTQGINYDIKEGIFLRCCENARAERRPYAIFIDEINRGKVSEIFGEIISLIEPSNRVIAPGSGMSITLPYSGKEFSVPGNLHIIGTMNSADRSIALMDVALRRRFVFHRIDPDYDTLLDILTVRGVSGAEISPENTIKILTKINERISCLLNQDFAIGHSYFIDVTTYDQLKLLFYSKIIPLLQEYFYDEWDRLCWVLHEDANISLESDFIIKKDIEQAFSGVMGEDKRFVYSIKTPDLITNEAFSKFF